MATEEIVWEMIDKFFKENPYSLVSHHLESYNDFFKNGIYKIFKEKNPIRINSNFDPVIDDYRNQCLLYMGGKGGDKLYFGKPIIYDDNNHSHYMYPNEARLRNMTYGMTIHYDVEVEYIEILRDGAKPSVIHDEPGDIEEIHESDKDYPSEHKFKNVKSRPLPSDKDEGVVKGGAPKKLPRAKRITREYQITPAMATKIREATEKSMVAPNTQRRTDIIKQVYLGKFPIMLHSDFCILKGLTPEIRHTLGECRQDIGGYFIIQGKEKTVVCQEKFADNMLYIRKYQKEGEDEDEEDLEYLYSSEIRSVSENVSKPVRTLAVRMVAPTKSYTNRNIVVAIPNVRKPVPLFIVFRALGVLTDKAIVEMCLLDTDKYGHMMDLFIPSVHDAGAIMTQRLALEYIASLTKGKRVVHAQEILADFFLPHVGEVNFGEKAFFLGYMTFRLLAVSADLSPPTDRDNFKYKRIELVGSLLSELFREYYTDQQKHIRVEFDKRLTLNQSLYANDLSCLINTFQSELFKERVLETGIKKAFKGNWGAKPNTKRIGVVQDLNRLSFNGYLSHLRKTNLPMDAGAKLVGPRVLHGSQWGFIDPIDTPDGGNIGLHKTLAVATHISRGGGGMRDKMVAWLRENISMRFLEECTTTMLGAMTKVMVSGYWAGAVLEPQECIRKIKLYRRNALIPIYTSATFDIQSNTIFVYTDDGRLCRPILYRDETTNKISSATIKTADFTWRDATTGFNDKRPGKTYGNEFHQLFELYAGVEVETNPAKLERFIAKKAFVDYIDSSESENALIAINMDEFPKKPHTHMEIHESLMFGTMCNLINFLENNPPTRNSFSCGQSKQACSIYHTNFHVRLDKTAVVLNSGQIPLVKSRYMEYINREENVYGVNTIVAIMCYSGYNMEDSILVNEGALQRGLFSTTYYTTYETHEEKGEGGETKYVNVESDKDIVGTKPGYDYSKLDKFGMIREGTEVDEKTVLIGMATSVDGRKTDASKTPKKGQLGVVDKSFMTEGEEGERIAKVRLREIRIPNLGDKMASRAGQKGTVGLVVPEVDMPTTKDGLRPDLIINPHAIPSRMTIGQLIECVMGKSCAMMGGFGDCTAFVNKGTKVGVFGEALTNMGYHSSGNEILYNGMTGEQLESEIFIGPTYYMRLKHMVKDKINYRARGPMTALTKQPVSGRANDGGLRIGEMERDSIISHGITSFLTDAMMERGDAYKLAICNVSGMAAIYNPAKKLFLSPMADGPIRFVGSLDGKDMNIDSVTKFGRSFSIVAVPYSLKLLIQELQTMNVQMRIITEDNIQQMSNLSFSNNIDKPEEYKNKIRQLFKPTTRTPESQWSDGSISEVASSFSPASPKFDDESEGTYAPSSEPQTPDYAPPPPEYEPRTPDFAPSSPLYEPRTPDYAPTSPYPSYEPPMIATPPSTPDFELGEIVFYRGDDIVGSQWKIINVGAAFITIQREGSEDVKIVAPDEIYRPTEMQLLQQQRQLPAGQSDASQFPTASTINFAPNIVVNGTAAAEVPKETAASAASVAPENQEIDFSKPLLIKKA